MTTHEIFCRLHKALDELSAMQNSPEVNASSYLQYALYSVQHNIVMILDDDKVMARVTLNKGKESRR